MKNSKKILKAIGIVAVLIVLLVLGKSVKNKISNLSLENTIKDTWLAYSPQDAEQYRVFTPDKEKYKQDKYPLIVWLHGAGELGTDNLTQMKTNDVRNLGSDNIQSHFQGAYVLAPQGVGEHDTKKIMNSIKDILKNNSDIDEDRIYIGGVSQGGVYTYAMVLEYPDFFAAAFPVSALTFIGGDKIHLELTKGVIYEGTNEPIVNLPIYIVHCIKDDGVSVSMSIDMYNYLKSHGNTDLHMTLFEKTGTSEKELKPHDMGPNVNENFPTILSDGSYREAFFNGDSITLNKAVFTMHPQGEVMQNVTSELPTDFGYDTFMDWLADQKRERK